VTTFVKDTLTSSVQEPARDLRAAVPPSESSSPRTARPRPRYFSLTRRIIAAVLISQVLLAIGLATAAIQFGRSQLHEAFNEALDGTAMATLALVRYAGQPPALAFQPANLPPPSDPNHPNLFEIRGSDGRLIVRSPGWDGVPAEISNSNKQYLDFLYRGTPYRAAILRDTPVLDSAEGFSPEKVTVYFATSLLPNFLQLSKLAIYVAVTSLAFLVIANSFTIWSIRRGLDPLRELARQAGAISVRNWDFRPPSGAQTARELFPLVEAIETVLLRLKAAFRQQRDFTNDAAHELKTSVSILKSSLQILIHRPRTQREYELGLEGLLVDCGRLEDLLDRMLRLARIDQLAETGALPKRATTELTSTCEMAIARIQAMAEERKVALEFQAPAAVTLRADPEDLELIWLNLLENAVQYSPPNSTVSVLAIAKGGGAAQISVLDCGPGIPPSELPYIFDRFHRGDPSRARSSGGFGLGLAICKALVDSYGGRIEAINRPEHGTEMRVSLPIS
jgi:signal transduction histidine kinase